MLHYSGKRPSNEELKQILEQQDNIHALIWVKIVGLILLVFGVFILFKIEDKLLGDLAQKFSQLCVAVIIGFAALVFTIAALEFKAQTENLNLKKSLYSLIEWIVYFSITNLILFLASYLPADLSKHCIRVSFAFSIFMIVFILWKFFRLMESLLTQD
jgi:uncharacterized membrane protein